MARISKLLSGFRLFAGENFNSLIDAVNRTAAGTGRKTYSTVPVGSVAYASFGTATTPVAGTVYLAEVYIPRGMTLAGIGILNGATVGTDSAIVGLFNSAGVLVASSALAGTVTANANAFQEIPFTANYSAEGTARYWIGYQVNGTTTRLRTVAASTFVDVRTKSSTGTFGTIPTQAPPTTFTADVGPIAYVYEP